MTDTTTRPIGRGVANGLLVALLDTVAIGSAATLLWLNGQTSVIDPPLPALIVTILIGAFFVALRRSVARRRQLTHGPDHVAAERTTVIIELALLAGLVITWQFTDIYELGWGALFASAALLVANALQLMIDVTTRSRQTPSRRARVHARRLASIEVLHIVAAIIGIIGLTLTASIHQWRGDILNGSVLIAAIAIGLGALASIIFRPATRPTPTTDTEPPTPQKDQQENALP